MWDSDVFIFIKILFKFWITNHNSKIFTNWLQSSFNTNITILKVSLYLQRNVLRGIGLIGLTVLTEYFLIKILIYVSLGWNTSLLRKPYITRVVVKPNPHLKTFFRRRFRSSLNFKSNVKRIVSLSSYGGRRVCKKTFKTDPDDRHCSASRTRRMCPLEELQVL